MNEIEKKITILANPAYKGKNPYCRLLYEEISNLGVEVKEFSKPKLFIDSYDVYHIHWPEYALNKSNYLFAVMGTCKCLALIIFLRLLGTKIVWTAHNLLSHDKKHPQLEKLFRIFFTRLLDGVICLTDFTKKALVEKFIFLKNKPIAVIPHGHFCHVYPNNITKFNARNILNLSQTDFVLAFVGQIRAYKNVPMLIEVFRTLPDKNVRLLIVGKPRTSELTEEIKKLAKDDDRILLYLDFVPDDDLQIYLNAADLVVLPFSDIFNSSTALLGLSFERPVLVPHKGSMIDLQNQFGLAWINTYKEELTTNHLKNSINWVLNESRSKPEALNNLEWNILAKQTVDFYELVVNSNK